MIKKTLNLCFLLVLLSVNGCGYKPILIGSDYDFSIKVKSSSGKEDINSKIENKLKALNGIKRTFKLDFASNETKNIRNIIALHDLAESDPDFTIADDKTSNFFIQNNSSSSPDNSVNNFDPSKIGQNLLNENIRDITNVNLGFEADSNLFTEGSDYSILENARKLDESEYSLNDQLGYISLQQPLNNDEILGVSFQYTLNGKVYQQYGYLLTYPNPVL